MATPKTDPAKSSKSLAANLWDEAYVGLKSQEPNQLKIYQETALLWLEASVTEVRYEPLIDNPLGDRLPAGLWRQWLSLQVRENSACSIESQIQCFIDPRDKQRNPALCDEQRGAPTNGNETSVKVLLDDLSAVDRQSNNHNVDRNKERNLTLLYEWLYWWISSFCEYKAFDVSQNRILWITGALGTGKLACMSAITWGLSQRKRGAFLPLFLSFSRYDNGQPKPENAASAIKSLIYAILMNQSCLVDILADELKSIGRNHLSYASDFYALSLILNRMIQDRRFQPTLVLVDSVDDIRGDDNEYNRFLKLMETTMSISSDIKWLVSADTLPSSHEINISLHISLDKDHPKKLEIFNNFYIPYKAKKLNYHPSHDETFNDQVIESLQKISSGDFLWADTAFEIARREDPQSVLDALQRLLDFLNSSKLKVSPYSFMMGKIFMLQPRECSRCLIILGTVAEVYQPIKLVELGALLNVSPNVDTRELITKHCFAFLEICGDLVSFKHRSARDFCIGHMAETLAPIRRRIAERCLHLSSAWFNFPEDNKQRQDPMTPTYYPAVYWIRHLCHVIDDRSIQVEALDLMTEHLLKWSDLLVLLGALPQACCLMLDLEADLKKELEARMSPAIFGAKNTLLFCPRNSTTRKQFLHQGMPQLAVSPNLDSSWSPIVHVLRGHTKEIRCCAYSHDGQYVASGSDDCLVRIWNAKTGKIQHIIRPFYGFVYGVAISSRGLIAASDQRSIKIWNFDNGYCQQATSSTTLDDDLEGTVSCMSFSNDGRKLAAAVDGQIKIWDTSTYSIIVSQEVAYQKSLVSGLAFSNSGALLASASGNRISLWKLIEEPAQDADSEAVDGAVNTEGKDIRNSPRLKKKKFFFLPKQHGQASQVAFSPDSNYMATIAGDVVYIWDLRSRRKPSILTGHESGVNAIAFSPDGSCLASASKDGTVRVWKAPWDDEHKQAQLILRGHSSEVYNLSFSPLEFEKYIVSCSADQTLFIWGYDRHEIEAAAGSSIEVGGEVDQQVSGHKKPISCLALSRDDKFVASGSSDGMICLWGEDLGSFRGQFCGHRDEILSLEFSHNSRYLLSSSQDRTVRVWDLENKLQPLLIQHTDWARSAVFSPDGKLVASGCDDRMVRVWDMQRLVDEHKNEASNDGIDYSYTHKLKGHYYFVTSVVFSNDGRYIAASGDDSRVLYWDLVLQEPGSAAIQSMKVLMQSKLDSEILSLIFNSDASSLIACSSDQIWIWDTATGQHATAKCSVLLHTLQLNPAYPEYVLTGLGPILIKDIREFDLVHVTPTIWCPYSFTNFENHIARGSTWHIPGGITWQGKEVIFLPKLYRGGIVQVRDHSVVVGCESGRLLFFRFKEDASFDDWP
ncbi:hypothetical protein ACHAPE_004562 [Trichoderma viride]